MKLDDPTFPRLTASSATGAELIPVVEDNRNEVIPIDELTLRANLQHEQKYNHNQFAQLKEAITILEQLLEGKQPQATVLDAISILSTTPFGLRLAQLPPQLQLLCIT